MAGARGQMAWLPQPMEIRVAMPDARHADATHTLAGWLALEAAALR
jgi:hypothetical protein